MGRHLVGVCWKQKVRWILARIQQCSSLFCIHFIFYLLHILLHKTCDLFMPYALRIILTDGEQTTTVECNKAPIVEVNFN